MNVCLYIRLSSADEDIKCKTESESVSNQRALLMRYLNSHNEFSGCEPVEFIDDGFSGVTGSRPAFERMIRFVRDGGSKVILVKDLSRFFRDYVEIGEYLERVFPALGVRLLSINDNYDSLRYKGTTAGLDVVLKCIVYSYYSRDLSRKTKSVSNIRKKKGMFLGANAPYGFLKDPLDCHHLIPDPAASVTVREIFQLAVEGNTTGKIAKILNSRDIETPAQHFHRMFPESGKFKKGVSSEKGWTAMEIQRIIQRFEYTGAVVNNRRVRKGVDQLHEKINDKSEWIIVEGCHEAIISKETFEAAQSCIIKKGPYVRKKQEYLLRGLVRCGCCKLAMPRIQIKKE